MYEKYSNKEAYTLKNEKLKNCWSFNLFNYYRIIYFFFVCKKVYSLKFSI